MIPPFDFATAGQILFGPGKIEQLPQLARQHKLQRVLVVTSKNSARIEPILNKLKTLGFELTLFAISHEPSISLIREGVQQALAAQCDGLIAIGGGSVIDGAKAIAALLRNTGDLLEYLEVIGKGRPLEQASAPWIAVPTTSGTGAEVTRNAVLYSPEHKVKISLRSATMLPVAAIVDPELTLQLSPERTAWSGMDALTQVIEPYVSARANPLTDALCLQAIPMVARSLPRAFHHGEDKTARTEMSLVSLYGGLALANAGLGVVHGFAGPLGGMYDAPHGAICAALLPYGMETNILSLDKRSTQDDWSRRPLERYRTVARLLTGNPTAEPLDGVAFVRNLCKELQIPDLSHWGMREEDADEVVEKSSRASSMKANPVKLPEDELRRVYLRAVEGQLLATSF